MIGRLTISPENMRALQQAIKQLQVQNGAMRDALAKARAAGKTVFLTREEAEKALEVRKMKKNNSYELSSRR